MGFSFGSFDRICETAALIPCAMLADSTGTGIEPVCYARNVEINGTILFQPGECRCAALVIPPVAFSKTARPKQT
jgi:hypothetical protein